MKTRGKPQHAHGKRGHGTCFLLAYLEELIGPVHNVPGVVRCASSDYNV
jgi:hypothetical protein